MSILIDYKFIGFELIYFPCEEDKNNARRADLVCLHDNDIHFFFLRDFI